MSKQGFNALRPGLLHLVLLLLFLCLCPAGHLAAAPAAGETAQAGQVQDSAAGEKESADTEILKRAGKAIEKKDYRSAVDMLTPLANKKNGEAAYIVGFLTKEGMGTKKSNTRAAQYFKIAADQGDIRGQNAYGMALAMGEGVRRNFLEASQWFAKAAEQGHAEAQYNLGYL